MKLSVKQKALSATVFFLAALASTVTVANYILNTVSTEVLLSAFGYLCVVWLIYTTYRVFLARYEYLQQSDEMVDKK